MSSSTPPTFGSDPAGESSHSPVNGSPYPPLHDPARFPPPYAFYQPEPPPPPTTADRWWAKSLVGLATAAVIALLGWPLGLLWAAVSPRMPVRVEADDLYIVDVYGEQRAAADGWFIIVSIAAGIVLAVLVWILLRRFRGSVTVAALAVGGGVAGWLMWWVGHNVGRAHFDEVRKTASVGTVLKYPIDLGIKNAGNVAKWHGWPVHVGGSLLYLGVAAVATYWIIALCASDSSLGIRRRRDAPIEASESSPLESPIEPATEPTG